MSIQCSIGNLLELSNQELPVVRIIVAATEGSVPREAGAAMIVSPSHTIGTIGGGQLEFQAIARARAMLHVAQINQPNWLRELHAYPLGPKLAQCCGGMVRVLFEKYGCYEINQLQRCYASSTRAAADKCGLFVRPTAAGHALSYCGQRQHARTFPLPIASIINQALSGQRNSEPALLRAPGTSQSYFIEPVLQPQKYLFIYGAGHVGRAIVKIAADLPFQIHWVDTHEHRFPETWPDNVVRIVARAPALIAKSSPDDAFHLVLTYSHALDFAICSTLLYKNNFRFLGLIGSETKRARFIKRFIDGGIANPTLSRLTCPIGLANLQGKAPAVIAVSVAAQLIEQLEQQPSAGNKAVKGDELEASKQLSA